MHLPPLPRILSVGVEASFGVTYIHMSVLRTASIRALHIIQLCCFEVTYALSGPPPIINPTVIFRPDRLLVIDIYYYYVRTV